MANLKLSGNMRVVSFCESSETPKEDSESLLKEAIAHLRIALGMHQMCVNEQIQARGEIREFIQKVEARI